MDARRGAAGRSNTRKLDELRSASHITRSAITRPLVAVQVPTPDEAVRTTARDMVIGAFSMRGHAHSAEVLATARETARDAHDRFVDAAAAYLTGA
ncbi:hypothetical protein AB0D58_34065 [Streptomyces sp. NPDC048210]|uniref:hypothetical protein n=1 Tax=Streptomyces sp. NPDC048210 TaxID=3156657 RepID=UPI003429561B